MGKEKREKERQKYPWVLPKGKKLPKMTEEMTNKYHLPVRTPEQDEKVLRPVIDTLKERPCVNGEKCVAVRDITGILFLYDN